MIFRTHEALGQVARPPATERSPTLERIRSAALAVLVLGITGGVALTLAGRLGGLHWWLDLWSHFPLQLAAGLGFCALTGATLGARRLALVAALGMAVNLALLAPLYRSPSPAGSARAVASGAGTSSGAGTASDSGAASEASEVDGITDITSPDPAALRLMAFNVLTRNPSKAEVMDYIGSEQADILALIETDERWLSALRERLPDYTIVAAAPQDDNFGMLLAIRGTREGLEVDASRVIYDLAESERSLPAIEARLRVDGRPLDLLQVHTTPPGGAYYSQLRDRQLAGAADWAAGRSARHIVLGDLNITPFSPQFDTLLRDRGLLDSTRGHGFQATWPMPGSALMGIPIDHVLHGPGIRVLDRRIGPILGSDHRPVVVDLLLVED